MPNVEHMSCFIGRLASPYISVQQDRCVLVRNRNADCLRCAAACTSGCISFDGERLHVSPEKCIGCGTCATVCPTCALEARHPTDDDLLESCLAALGGDGGGKFMAIACGNASASGEASVVRLECLGRVEESLLTELAAAGAERISLMHGDCESCEHKTGRAVCEQVLACERELMGAWGRDTAFELVDAGAGHTRGNDDAAPLPAVEEDEESFRVVKVTSDGTQPHFIPDRRERLLNALAKLGEPGDAWLTGRLWAHVQIDVDKCMGCRMCTVFCPSGALARFNDSADEMGIEHRPGDCSSCGTCAAICINKAISILPGVYASQLFDGSVQRIAMVPRSAHRGTAHSIWHTMEGQMNTTQVYER